MTVDIRVASRRILAHMLYNSGKQELDIQAVLVAHLYPRQIGSTAYFVLEKRSIYSQHEFFFWKLFPVVIDATNSTRALLLAFPLHEGL